MFEGIVMKSTGSWYTIRTIEGNLIPSRVRGKLRLKDLRATNPVAVGDKVRISQEADGTGIIHEVLQRENYLIRRAIKKTSHGHILAANLDQAMLIATITYPRTSLGFIDRFLVAAESFRIPCILVFNKTDMWNDAMWEFAEELAAIYPPLGVKFYSVSAMEERDVETIKTLLKGKTTLLAGHSGVGKSTLLNKMDPSIQQKTSEVSDFANKGTHTTTFAEMFSLSPDTFVIDTPGIKELGLLDFYDEEICHFFPEMRDLFGQCRFYNCTHTHEPGCAVIQAVEEGKIAPSRYESYLGIITEEESHR
ncbi:MAG: ribosome small subunit-dependent GTPase A [Cyclobacteriaceae bacterium]|nr:ribosome small subunit-dependent GTPase A [Cyclobacteriaceae bacterium]